MKDLKIIDILQSPVAISPSAGLKVFEVINSFINKEESIRLFFDGIEDCTTAFCNATIGKLFMRYSQEKLKQLLIFPDLDQFPIWKDKIERSIQLGTDENMRESHQQNLTDLLAS